MQWHIYSASDKVTHTALDDIFLGRRVDRMGTALNQKQFDTIPPGAPQGAPRDGALVTQLALRHHVETLRRCSVTSCSGVVAGGKVRSFGVKARAGRLCCDQAEMRRHHARCLYATQLTDVHRNEWFAGKMMTNIVKSVGWKCFSRA